MVGGGKRRLALFSGGTGSASFCLQPAEPVRRLVELQSDLKAPFRQLAVTRARRFLDIRKIENLMKQLENKLKT